MPPPSTLVSFCLAVRSPQSPTVAASFASISARLNQQRDQQTLSYVHAILAPSPFYFTSAADMIE